MSSLPELVALTALQRAVATRVSTLRAEVETELREQYTDTGADRWRLPTGTVRLDHPDPKPVIVDPAAARAWLDAAVAESRELVSIRRADMDAVVAAIAAAGVDVERAVQSRDEVEVSQLSRLVRADVDTWVDRATGLAVPGVGDGPAPRPRMVVSVARDVQEHVRDDLVEDALEAALRGIS